MKALSKWNKLTIFLIAGFVLTLSQASIARPRAVVVHKPHRTIVYPKHGKAFRVLPVHHRKIVVGKLHYFYCDGVFYNTRGPEFIVIKGPAGAGVETIPIGYKIVNRRGREYYYVNNTYFRPEIRNGKRVYVVVRF